MIGAAAGGIFILPFFLFSATSGQLADKYEKTMLVRWIKVCEIFFMIMACVGFLKVSPYLLFGTLFLMGLHSTFFGPIKYSILPQLLPTNELVDGNALVEMGTFLAILLGSIAGGVLIGFEPIGVETVSIGLIGVAFIGWFFSRKIQRTIPGNPGLKIEWNPLKVTWRILQETKKDKSVFYSVLGISWFWFYGAAFLAIFASYTKEVLNCNQNVGVLFLTFFSVGIAIGSMLCGRLSKGQLELGLVPVGSAGMSLFALDLFFVGKPWPSPADPQKLFGLLEFFHRAISYRIAADLLLLSCFSGLFIVPLYTLIQLRTSDKERSQIVAGNNIWNSLVLVISSLFVLGSLALKFSIPAIFLQIAVLNLLVMAAIYWIMPEFIYRLAAWMLAHIFYRFRKSGFEKFPKIGPAIIVCNHVSFIDWLFISAAVRRPIRFVMEESFTRMPFFHGFFERAKVIPIAAANPKLVSQAFDKIANELQAGSLVCIFPEGKLTRTGEMNEFRPGIERILARNKVPVVPMALEGMWGSLFTRADDKVFPGKLFSRIHLICGEPVPPEQASAQLLQEKVMQLMGST